MFDEDCEPCRKGVILETARQLCRIVGNSCDIEYQKAVLGEITIKDFISAAKSKVSNDKDALFTINEIEKMV